MTELIGTDERDRLVWEEGVTFVDGRGGRDDLRINPAGFFGGQTFTITSGNVSTSGGESLNSATLNVDFINIEFLELVVRDGVNITIDASQYAIIDESRYTLSLQVFGSDSTIIGSSGNDRMYFQSLGHNIDAGAGFDSITFSPTYGSNIFDGSAVRLSITAEDGFAVVVQQNDSFTPQEALRVQNAERLTILPVSFVRFEVDGSLAPMNLSLFDGSGSDTLIGGAFDDNFLQISTDPDFQNDLFTGGGGADFFSFGRSIRTMDGTVISDFRPEDSISFDTFGFPATEIATSFIGTADFTGIAGEYRYFTNNGRTFIQFDGDGDGFSDADLELASGEFELEQFTRREGDDHNIRIAGYIAGNDRDETLVGTSEGDRFFGSTGNDIIDGGSNVDIAGVSGNMADYTVTQTSLGVFEVVGADGTDTLTNIEFLQFDDQTMRLLRGTGIEVNFETADPSVYQPAMNNILDFGGNALGGNGSWLRIGSADVNGDGDIDQILVNDAIGRFATVGTAPDGLVYFDDNSWAGETRVAGIYIDPLVASGEVVRFSDNDSQQRFQNDLAIENINRVLGADDYDGDGLQDVYFALTDGTAYLRAVMEADGNIRYANYQSEEQVIEFLTANGFGEETYGDWFGAASAQEESEVTTFINVAATSDEGEDKQVGGSTNGDRSIADLLANGPFIDPIEATFAGPGATRHTLLEIIQPDFYG